ncbi:hypothetical protein ACFQWH_09255 [Mycolicibacterium sp. GCM10028919]|uniref:hypothetical protein n=1 Tax=Mycolicibacterium sp. GCM10028919 TaxID=3273401 RepID=UPI00361C2309
MARFVLTEMDIGPDDLYAQLPALVVDARMFPGDDRPDYCIGLLERPLRFQPPATFDMARADPRCIGDDVGSRFLWIYALVVCPRIVGDRFHRGMTNLVVNVAYVIDSSQAGDKALHFEKCEPVGFGYITDPD